MKLRIVQFTALFLLMMVTGVFWGTWFTLTRSIDSFSSSEFIHIGHVIIANVAVPMRIIMPACILFTSLSMWFYKPKKSLGFICNAAAFILIVVSLLITLLVLVPIDNQLKHLTEATVPSNWEDIRTRWQSFHSDRTFVSMASFAFFALSILVRDDEDA